MLKIEFDETKDLVIINDVKYSQEIFRKWSEPLPDTYHRVFLDNDNMVNFESFRIVTEEDEPDGSDIKIRKMYQNMEELQKDLGVE